jgi:hypothetical protein
MAVRESPDRQITAICRAPGGLSLRRYSLVRPDAPTELAIGEDFTDAAVSPANPSRVAVLRANKVTIYDDVGSNDAAPWEITLPEYVLNAKKVFWSPFGSRIMVAFAPREGRVPVITFVEVGARKWKIEDDG